MTGATREALSLDSLSDKGLFWHASSRVTLNPLDTDLCKDVYEAYLARHSKLYVYPITSYALPSLFVAALLVDTFGRKANKDLVPRVLFYTGIDGRDIYRDLGVGVQLEKISETFGFVRLDADGRPIDPIKLNTRPPLVVTGHCALPKDASYKPDIVVVDASGFNPEHLVQLVTQAVLRWPKALFYVVTSDPLTPFIRFASENGWRMNDSLRAAPKMSTIPTGDSLFSGIARQLSQAADGIRYSAEVVSNEPCPAWNDLREIVSLARKHAKALQTARSFLGVTKWLLALAVHPSEFESYRLSNMLSFEGRLEAIRDNARHESGNAQLIAGGVTLLRDVNNQLEKRNWKREALLETILAASYSRKRVTILVQKPGMRAVLSQAMQVVPEFTDMLNAGQLAVLAASQIAKAQVSDLIVIPGIMAHNSIWTLRTAAAPEMLFLLYGTEVKLQEWCMKEICALEAPSTLVTEPTPTMSATGTGPPDSTTEDELAIELLDLLHTQEIESDEVGVSDAAASGPRREIIFEDGSSVVVQDGSFLHTVTDQAEPVAPKRAHQIEPGDTVLVVNGDVHQSLFELLRDRVDGQTSLSRAIEVVRAFQLSLKSGFAKSGQTVESLHQRLVAAGSSIIHPGSVMQWIDAVRFGPGDARDIQRLGAVLSIASFSDRAADFFRAMQRVRVAHRELGRVLVRVLKQAYRETDSRSVKIFVDGEAVVLYDVLDAMALKRVVETRKV